MSIYSRKFDSEIDGAAWDAILADAKDLGITCQDPGADMEVHAFLRRPKAMVISGDY